MRVQYGAKRVGRKAALASAARPGTFASDMISIREAREMITARVPPLGPVAIAPGAAHGRVLREEVAAAEDFPAFDRSAMDGYAVAQDDASGEFRVVAEVRTGEQPVFTLRKGECARVFTGARLPEGATQVIMQEDVERVGDVIRVSRRSSATHVRARGEEQVRWPERFA